MFLFRIITYGHFKKVFFLYSIKMSLTSIAGKLFLARQKKLEQHINGAETLQHNVLNHLIEKGRYTEYGRKHLFSSIKNYDDFTRNVPVNTYEELKADIDRMRHGEPDVLWPGTVKWFAKSSGTTNDKSKFIPISPEGLHHIHYQGGADVVAFYLRNNPDSRFFSAGCSTAKASYSAAATRPTTICRTALWATSAQYL